MSIPLTETIALTVSQLFADAKTGEYRDPTHSDIEFQIKKAGLHAIDPRKDGLPVGKAKRIRAVLIWAVENDQGAGVKFLDGLIATLRSAGGFRSESPNFVGKEQIDNLNSALSSEGYHLGPDGEIRSKVLDSLSNKEMTEALKAYARRAAKGADDAALLAGTGKDLIEATAAHILIVKLGKYEKSAHFGVLLAQAYSALQLAIGGQQEQPGEPATKQLERAMFQAAIAVNRLRNREGTGHGRPWLPNLSQAEARAAVELVGCVAGYLLEKLENR